MPRPPRYRPALIVGTLASALLAASSYVVAPLGTASTLWQQPWFQAIRGSSSLALAATIAVTVAGFALLAAWLAVRPGRQPKHPLSLKQTLTLAVCWAAPLAIALPLTSQDVYSYIAVGHLTAAGYNPYTTGIDALPDWQSYGVYSAWASTPTPYGPIMLAIGWAIVTVTAPLGLLGAVAGFRLAMIAALGLTAWGLIHIARHTGANPATALWAAIANPLTLISCVLGIHNDTIVIAAVVGGFAAAHGTRLARRDPLDHDPAAKYSTVPRNTAMGARGRTPRLIAAWAALTAATGVKLTAGLAYPPTIAIAAAPGQTRRRTLAAYARAYAGMGVGCLVTLFIASWAVGGSIQDWVTATIAVPHLARPLWYVPLQLLSGLSIAGPGEGVTPGWVSVMVTVVGAATIIAAAIIAVWPSRRAPAERFAIAYLVLLAGSTVIWPWYLLLWLVAIAASGAATLQRWLPAVALSGIFFTTQSLSAGFFDTSALPADVTAVFNVLPGVLGVVWVAAIGVWMWLRRQRNASRDGI